MLAKGGCGDLFVGIDEAMLRVANGERQISGSELDLVGTRFSEDPNILTSMYVS